MIPRTVLSRIVFHRIASPGGSTTAARHRSAAAPVAALGLLAVCLVLALPAAASGLSIEGAEAPTAVEESAPPVEPARIQPGVLDLDLAERTPSSIGMDLGELEHWLCGGSPPVHERGGGSEDCRLVINEDGGIGGLLAPSLLGTGPPAPVRLAVHGEAVLECGQRTVYASVADLWAVSPPDQPLATACGTWSFVLSLDPERVQPLSALSLLGGGGSDRFVGGLEVAARLTFQRLEDGETVARPHDLSIDIAGRWALHPAPPAGVTDLVLFAEQQPDGTLVPRSACGGAGGKAGCGLVCLAPAAGWIGVTE